MKKLFLLIFLLLIIVAGVFFLKNDRSDEENVSTISGPPAHQIYDAIRELTTAQFTDYGMAIALLVPGASISKNTWDFRGNARSAERDKPFFGTIKNKCQPYSDNACWELISLNLDGSELPITTNFSPTETIDQNSKTPSQKTVQKKPDNQQKTKQQEPKAEPDAITGLQIWRTRTKNVNGRTGPGTNFKIAFKIPDSIDLGLIEKRDGWGLFRYDAEGGKEGKIWISMRLVLQK